MNASLYNEYIPLLLGVALNALQMKQDQRVEAGPLFEDLETMSYLKNNSIIQIKKS